MREYGVCGELLILGKSVIRHTKLLIDARPFKNEENEDEVNPFTEDEVESLLKASEGWERSLLSVCFSQSGDFDHSFPRFRGGCGDLLGEIRASPLDEVLNEEGSSPFEPALLPTSWTKLFLDLCLPRRCR
jgi:hypothetical protein